MIAKGTDHKSAILYGVAILVSVFIVVLLAFPLRANDRPLFESVMPVALTLAVTSASAKYFKKVTDRFAYIGLYLGLIWLGVSLAADLLMFSAGPMKMTLADYIKDIGLTYFIILIIPLGVGYVLQRKNEKTVVL